MGVCRSFKKLIRKWTSSDVGIRYARNFNPDKGASQGGEDGALHEVFRRLGIQEGWFVEFGAWDGIHCSNTYALTCRNWKGVYIEVDPAKHAELERNMASCGGRVICLSRFVGVEGEDSLDSILASTPIPKDFDLLSIDIDSNDYWVWKSVRLYSPKVVIIEYNCNFHAHECKSIPFTVNGEWDGTLFYGASAAALVKLGKTKGYTLVGHSPGLNLIFVLSDLVPGKFRQIPVEAVTVGPAHRQARRDEFVEV